MMLRKSHMFPISMTMLHKCFCLFPLLFILCYHCYCFVCLIFLLLCIVGLFHLSHLLPTSTTMSLLGGRRNRLHSSEKTMKIHVNSSQMKVLPAEVSFEGAPPLLNFFWGLIESEGALCESFEKSKEGSLIGEWRLAEWNFCRSIHRISLSRTQGLVHWMYPGKLVAVQSCTSLSYKVVKA